MSQAEFVKHLICECLIAAAAVVLVHNLPKPLCEFPARYLADLFELFFDSL